ncbi:DUF2300 domain-containing protein [Roseateles sp. BYS96W]|uniref:DUF2300 domain-containing protein n=1 Tax=Pelomonas nitida TaxID=3299027 RepID=A0ABW7G2S6_9BURK
MKRLSRLVFATAVLAGAGLGARAAPTPQLAWRAPSGELATPAGARLPAQVPLGSTWKLFVYGYLVTTGAQEPLYRCGNVKREPGDEYCCEPGESIGRDAALQRSCGAYFEPRRLKLDADNWQRFWADRQAPAWLQALPALRPASTVPVPALLEALQRMPDAGRLAAREALLPNTLREPALLAALGSGPRFKTWSWTDAQGERFGGAAGWLADGTAFWIGGAGTGQQVMQRDAARLTRDWAGTGQLTARPDAATLQAQPCVDVRFFARYPLARVLRRNGQPAAAGPLNEPGTYTLKFANGQQLVVPSQPGLLLTGSPIAPRLQARMTLEEYVARVVDREGVATETAAARALAIAARSWLQQNAVPSVSQGCLMVDDDSRAQRVSPRPPSPAAESAARFTAGLVLRGAPVRYALDRSDAKAEAQLLGWREAVAASRAGQGMEALLRQAFPTATLTGWQAQGDCQPLPLAAQWLTDRMPRWQRQLRREVGYEPLDAPPQVCQLEVGTPHADLRRSRLWLREWQTRDGRVTLIHEYLHLAFRRHPRGQDENDIERLAQQLADL